jgi:hypothetical protein
MQFCSASATASHYMRLCHRRNIRYGKGINYATILSSIADLLLLVVTDEQLCAVPVPPAVKKWWLFAADVPASA